MMAPSKSRARANMSAVVTNRISVISLYRQCIERAINSGRAVTERDSMSLRLHQEGVQLVAIGVAEIAGVEAAATVAGRTFAPAAISKRDVVQPLHLRLVLGLQSDHHAVADARRIAVERLGNTDPGTAARLAPGDELLIVHHTPDTELAAQRVIELGGLTAVVVPVRHIADHAMSSFLPGQTSAGER